jgi:hypothetical protein
MGQTAHSINQPSDETPRRAPYAMNPTEAVLFRSRRKNFWRPNGNRSHDTDPGKRGVGRYRPPSNLLRRMQRSTARRARSAPTFLARADEVIDYNGVFSPDHLVRGSPPRELSQKSKVAHVAEHATRKSIPI